MRHLLRLLLIALCVSFVVPVHAQKPTATQTVVQNRTKAFYRWYVGQLNRNKYPFDDRATTRRYVSRRLEKWLYSPAYREFGADYFVNAQDFETDWTIARTSRYKRSGNKATLRVVLGNPKPAQKGIGPRTLDLTWIREGGVWKIDRVNGN